MQVKIEIRSTLSDAEIVETTDCTLEGDVQNAVASTLLAFREKYPNNPPFAWILSVGKAGHA